jgi:hypothetical protein
MRSTFEKRVISDLKRDKWNILYTSIPFIDFFSVRPHTHAKKAYHVRAHGHISHKVQKALQEYGKSHQMHMIYVHEVSCRELEFIRLYPRNL